ncbi:MAG: family 43 glycosylhydrolase [Muribaculaceae bacterium]|nr:family 43 glycosylhydrolase [Muribaculaceae bacterium]
MMLFALVLTLSALAQGVKPSGSQYRNPVIDEDAADPTVISGDDGYYYLLATGEKVYRSSNLVDWVCVGDAFGDNPHPTFVPEVKRYWAPCVTRQNGRYVLYFALSTWGGVDAASIGVATASSAAGPFKLVGDGKLFSSGEVGVRNSIDPNYIEDDGHKYIVWGSWFGIWLIELTDDGLAVKDLSVKHQIAGTRFEAPYVYKRGDYYYLFCSIGACCEGARSTYETVVGRATNLFGPYYDKEGMPMLGNACTIMLTTNDVCIAPGHNSRIIEDEAGKTWMFFHGYLRTAPEKGRIAWLDEVKWDGDGWPHVTGNGASWGIQEAPATTR